MNFSKNEKLIIFKTLRLTLYFTILVGAVYSMHFLATFLHENTFTENGVVENIQLSFLTLAGIIFSVEALTFKKYRPILFLLASLCFLGSCRKLDEVLDRKFAPISWRIGFIFPVAALINLAYHRKNITKHLLKFLDSPAFYMMFSAMVAILPFGELIGHGPFVANVLGPENKAAVKELFEEACELLGYLIILLSTFECFLFVRKK